MIAIVLTLLCSAAFADGIGEIDITIMQMQTLSTSLKEDSAWLLRSKYTGLLPYDEVDNMIVNLAEARYQLRKEKAWHYGRTMFLFALLLCNVALSVFLILKGVISAIIRRKYNTVITTY